MVFSQYNFSVQEIRNNALHKNVLHRFCELFSQKDWESSGNKWITVQAGCTNFDSNLIETIAWSDAVLNCVMTSFTDGFCEEIDPVMLIMNNRRTVVPLEKCASSLGSVWRSNSIHYFVAVLSVWPRKIQSFGSFSESSIQYCHGVVSPLHTTHNTRRNWILIMLITCSSTGRGNNVLRLLSIPQPSNYSSYYC